MRETRDEFEKSYAELSRVTVEELHAYGLKAYACECGDPACRGWAMLSEENARHSIWRV